MDTSPASGRVSAARPDDTTRAAGRFGRRHGRHSPGYVADNSGYETFHEIGRDLRAERKHEDGPEYDLEAAYPSVAAWPNRDDYDTGQEYRDALAAGAMARLAEITPPPRPVAPVATATTAELSPAINRYLADRSEAYAAFCLARDAAWMAYGRALSQANEDYDAAVVAAGARYDAAVTGGQ